MIIIKIVLRASWKKMLRNRGLFEEYSFLVIWDVLVLIFVSARWRSLCKKADFLTVSQLWPFWSENGPSFDTTFSLSLVPTPNAFFSGQKTGLFHPLWYWLFIGFMGQDLAMLSPRKEMSTITSAGWIYRLTVESLNFLLFSLEKSNAKKKGIPISNIAESEF